MASTSSSTTKTTRPPSEPQACPDRGELRRFHTGELDDEQRIDHISGHLDVCATCLAALESIETDEPKEPLIDALRRSAAARQAQSSGQSVEQRKELQDCRRLAHLLANRAWDSGPLHPPCEFGPFTVHERIGSGGWGTVYRAEHGRHGEVALKVLHTYRADQGENARFQEEFATLDRLSHENIVRVVDRGEVNGRHYLATEFVGGDTFGRFITDEPLLPRKSCELILQALKALDHIHQNGLVHRDVKPSNLIVGGDGVVKLLDMGIARPVDDRATSAEFTATGQLLGTLRYLAPERWQFPAQADIRADVFSLGRVFCELLEHHKARGGLVPKRLKRIAKRMSDHDRQDRYQSPREAIRAIERSLRKGRLRARIRKMKWRGSYRWSAALFAAVVFLAVLVPWAVWKSLLAPHQPRDEVHPEITRGEPFAPAVPVSRDAVPIGRLPAARNERSVSLEPGKVLAFQSRLAKGQPYDIFWLRAPLGQPLILQVVSQTGGFWPYAEMRWSKDGRHPSDGDAGSGRGGRVFHRISGVSPAPDNSVRLIVKGQGPKPDPKSPELKSGDFTVCAWLSGHLDDVDPNTLGLESSPVLLEGDARLRGRTLRRKLGDHWFFGSPPAIDYPGDVDAFQVQPVQSQPLKVVIDGRESRFDPYLRVYDAKGRQLAAGGKRDPLYTSRAVIDKPQPGETYYFSVNAYRKGETGKYLVQVKHAEND